MSSGASAADEFALGDLRETRFCGEVIDRPFDEIYQLAAAHGRGYKTAARTTRR